MKQRLTDLIRLLRRKYAVSDLEISHMFDMSVDNYQEFEARADSKSATEIRCLLTAIGVSQLEMDQVLSYHSLLTGAETTIIPFRRNFKNQSKKNLEKASDGNDSKL